MQKITKIWYFCWALLQKCCFSCSVNTICINSFRYTDVITYRNFDLTKVANDKGKQPKWKLTLNKPWNWSNCTKLAVSASRTHGLIAQSVTLSERISVVAGSNPTQANILKLLQKIVQWWIPYIVAHSVTLVITYRKVRLNKRGHWRRQTA